MSRERERIELHTEKAAVAMSALLEARTDLEKLAAAKALESASCQLRRALKAVTA